MPKKDRKAEKRRAKAAAKAAATADKENGVDKAAAVEYVGGRPTREVLGFVSRSGPDAPRNRTQNMDIEVTDINMFAGRQQLLSGATLRLADGFKYGLVGRNGVGKSTLLRAVAEQDIQIPDFIFVMHVEQEIAGDDTPVLQAVLKADKEREWLLEAEQKLLNTEVKEGQTEQPTYMGIDLMEVYERLDELDSENAESRAATILAGLGFDNEAQARPTKEYSGGWRMRIALAQALFMTPDLLLLDEPTNHLDVPALTWLEEFLASWEKTVIIVSHDRGFLNQTTSHTIFLHRKRLWYYGGNYDTFLRVRAEHRANQAVMAGVQERRVAQLKQFIARFGHGSKKMARQAQSRMKMLSKLQDEAVEVDYDDPYLQLNFPAAAPLPPPCISVLDATFGYTPDRPLYKHLNFGVDCDSRVAIVGPNGAGKSTFLKLLDGSLDPTDGAVRRHSKLSLARFTQHHVDALDLSVDAVTTMRRMDPEISIENCRKYLGHFGLAGDLALQPIETLSGGQKSRVIFAQIAYKHPHLLLMDEPTNHLDLETIEGLALALNRQVAGLSSLQTDASLADLKEVMVADELWVVMPGKKDPSSKTGWRPGSVTVFEGTFEDYVVMLKDEFAKKQLIGGGRIKTLREPYPPLTPVEEGLLADLTRSAAVDNALSEDSMSALLLEWWGLVTIGGSTAPDLPRDERWKSVGFQSGRPSTDFRTGPHALLCMVQAARAYGPEFREMVAGSDGYGGGASNRFHYPFAATAINVHFMLLHYLRMVDGFSPVTKESVLSSEYERKVFASAMALTAGAFEDLFTATCMAVHAHWTRMVADEEATLMDFQESLAYGLSRAANALVKANPVRDEASWHRVLRNILRNMTEFSRGSARLSMMNSFLCTVPRPLLLRDAGSGGQVLLQKRGFAKIKLKKKNLFPKNPYLKVNLPPNQGPMPYKYQLPKLEYHRFTGNRAQKCAPIKTLFQISAEKEFLLMRAQRPAGYVYNLSEDDLSAAPAELRQTLSLACASEKQVSKFRRYQLLQKFQRSAFDTGSLPVKIAILTERILNMRATNIVQERNTRAKQAIKMALCRRNRVMKALFTKDFELYKWVVKQLGLRLVRFNYMALKDPSKTVNAIAVDGDKVKWMLQQRLWRHRYRPRNVKHPQTGKLVRYTRHLVKPPPANFGKPVPVGSGFDHHRIVVT
ncbi:ATP-binding cassette sub- F member 3 [Perkinsus olseni]|uniref:ATP-binding cassette sub- F member 3 n=1 Tax=Perkinsus olseni TaxID=32597 RepID=A0A7J6LSG9_PEROL|nr:ATP-binding cassette sub- F member 3 [Perkinsus olseni]